MQVGTDIWNDGFYLSPYPKSFFPPDHSLSLTPKSGKFAIFGRALIITYIIEETRHL